MRDFNPFFHQPPAIERSISYYEDQQEQAEIQEINNYFDEMDAMERDLLNPISDNGSVFDIQFADREHEQKFADKVSKYNPNTVSRKMRD